MNEERTDGQVPAPWHFKLMVVLVILYLGWRLVEGLVWVWHAIF